MCLWQRPQGPCAQHTFPLRAYGCLVSPRLHPLSWDLRLRELRATSWVPPPPGPARGGRSALTVGPEDSRGLGVSIPESDEARAGGALSSQTSSAPRALLCRGRSDLRPHWSQPRPGSRPSRRACLGLGLCDLLQVGDNLGLAAQIQEGPLQTGQHQAVASTGVQGPPVPASGSGASVGKQRNPVNPMAQA